MNAHTAQVHADPPPPRTGACLPFRRLVIPTRHIAGAPCVQRPAHLAQGMLLPPSQPALNPKPVNAFGASTSLHNRRDVFSHKEQVRCLSPS